MLDAVNDRAVGAAENNVAVFSHQLYDQCFLAQITHFIEVFDIKMNDTFHVRLINFYDPSVCDMFAQQHTKIWCRQWTGFVCFCQIQKRQRSTRGHGKTELPVTSF